MPTQPNEHLYPKGSVNHERLKTVLVRWEQAVYAQEDAIGDDADAAVKELNESREAVLELLRDAKVVADAPESKRWEYVIGKVLKDWATALMATGELTREKAREVILVNVMSSTARAQAARRAVADHDHLPEGSS